MSVRRLLQQREVVSCALCGSTESETALLQDCHGLNLRTAACVQCGLLYLSPRPAAAAYAAFYDGAYHELYPSRAGFAGGVFSRKTAEARVTAYAPFLRDPGARLLEVGAGDGSFLKAMQSAMPQVNVSGIDTAPAEVATCLAQQLDVQVMAIEEEPRTGFTHIAAFHTLEHATDPVSMIRSMSDHLIPGGMLLLEVPDIESEWSGLGMIHVAHPYMYSQATLTALLQRNGFRVLTAERLTDAPFAESLRVVAVRDDSMGQQPAPAADAEAVCSVIRRKAGNLQLQALLRGVRLGLRFLLPPQAIALLWRVKNFALLQAHSEVRDMGART